MPGAFVEMVTVTGDGLAAGGSAESEGRFQPTVWRSEDGLTWDPAEILPVIGAPGEPTATAIIETRAGLTALGYMFEGWPVAYVWVFR